MRLPRPRTLRGRLAFFYAAILAVVLTAFSAIVYMVAMEDEAQEIARGEAPDRIDRRVLLALGVGLPAGLLIAVAGGLWIARRALAPVDEVVRVAGNLDVENLEQRIPRSEGAGEEVERLVTALNAMLERIERSVGGLRRFTADASHELRTPISALMGDLEVALRRPREVAELRTTMESALEELGRLSRLIDGLLTLARSDAGELPIQSSEVDTAELVERVLEPYQEIASERGVSLSVQRSNGARAIADPLWLGRALANLVDNACKFTPRGGRIVVSVESMADKVRINVSDSGPGLSSSERERAFERFYRGDAVRGSSDGFGLGLPLAKEIARAMGGDLALLDQGERGTLVCLELPASRR